MVKDEYGKENQLQLMVNDLVNKCCRINRYVKGIPQAFGFLKILPWSDVDLTPHLLDMSA